MSIVRDKDRRRYTKNVRNIVGWRPPCIAVWIQRFGAAARHRHFDDATGRLLGVYPYEERQRDSSALKRHPKLKQVRILNKRSSTRGFWWLEKITSLTCRSSFASSFFGNKRCIRNLSDTTIPRRRPIYKHFCRKDIEACKGTKLTGFGINIKPKSGYLRLFMATSLSWLLPGNKCPWEQSPQKGKLSRRKK